MSDVYTLRSYFTFTSSKFIDHAPLWLSLSVGSNHLVCGEDFKFHVCADMLKQTAKASGAFSHYNDRFHSSKFPFIFFTWPDMYTHEKCLHHTKNFLLYRKC